MIVELSHYIIFLGLFLHAKVIHNFTALAKALFPDKSIFRSLKIVHDNFVIKMAWAVSGDSKFKFYVENILRQSRQKALNFFSEGRKQKL